MTLATILLYTAALSCPDTKIINQSGLPFNEHDAQTLESAKLRCEQKYPKSPCLKKFYKRSASRYAVLCGKKE